jgi:hypothetical protein
VFFIKLREQPLNMFRKVGLFDLIDENHLFRKTSEAIEAIEFERVKRGIFIE